MTYRGKSFAANNWFRSALSVLPVRRRAHGALLLIVLTSLPSPRSVVTPSSPGCPLLYHKWRYLKKRFRASAFRGGGTEIMRAKSSASHVTAATQPPRPPRPLRTSPRTGCTRAFGCPVWNHFCVFYSDSLVSVSQNPPPLPLLLAPRFSLCFCRPHSSIRPTLDLPLARTTRVALLSGRKAVLYVSLRIDGARKRVASPPKHAAE
jgi:hypothetical protein